MSVCPPPLWAHRHRQIVWQSNMSSPCVLLHMVMSLKTKLHSKDLIPTVVMVAAAHTPCQGDRFA